MQSSRDPPHLTDPSDPLEAFPPDPLEAFPTAPSRAYCIDGVVLMVLSSSMLRGLLVCLVVVLILGVLACLVVLVLGVLICLVVVSSSDEDGSGHRS